jgi:carboxypeptidase Taq
LYAAQLIAAASKDIGKLETLFQQGDFQPLLQWLRQHIHHHGKRYLPGELVRRITGQPISAEPFLAYLRLKLQNVGLLA